MQVRLIKSCLLRLGKTGQGARNKHCYIGNFRGEVGVSQYWPVRPGRKQCVVWAVPEQRLGAFCSPRPEKCFSTARFRIRSSQDGFLIPFQSPEDRQTEPWFDRRGHGQSQKGVPMH
jgi:hypothetical protein